MHQSFVLLIVFSCQKFQSPDSKTLISRHDDDESHNNGRNCVDCHYSAGYAEGFFTLAGSAEGNTQGAFFDLHKEMNAPAIMTIEVDQLGNAYTTETIDYEGGLYVKTRASNGDEEWKEDKIFSGQCNLCHGTSVAEPIEID